MSSEAVTRRDTSAALKQFLEFVSSGRAKTEDVASVLADRDISSEKFFSVIPAEVAEVAILLRTPLAFEAFASQAPAATRELIDRAKAAARANLIGIEEHPVVTKLVQDKIRGLSGEDTDAKPGVLTELNNVRATQMWLDTKRGITPIAWVLVEDAKTGALLRGTFDLDDLSFLTESLVELLRDELKRAQQRSQQLNVEIPYADAVAERIGNMAKASQEMIQLESALNRGKRSDSQTIS